MARKNNNLDLNCWNSKKIMSIGLLLVISGLIYNMSQRWDYVLISVGALLFVKGLALKFMKK